MRDAPKGAKPAIVMVDTSALSAKILAVNTAKRSEKKTAKLGSKVNNLDQLQAGETVDMVMTESLVVEIVK